jgi:hypothetical protein
MRRFGRSSFGLPVAWTVAVAAAATWAPGCFVTIADPAIDSTGGRSTAGAGGGRDASTGGQSNGGADASRESGATGGTGGRGGSGGGCGVCNLPNVKRSGCADAGCTIVECDDGFVDCDGRPDNGCETDFRVEVGDASTSTIALKAKQTIIIDGDAGEWPGSPLYPMDLPCTACNPNQPGGQNGEKILYQSASPADLTAAFRVAWDANALYVFAQVRDDQIVAGNATNLEQQDGIELLTDGDLNDLTPNYGPDVHHLFVGAIAKNVLERNQTLPSGYVELSVRPEQKCYFVEMRLRWFYLMGLIMYTPVPGDRHGFTIAVNDWDVAPGAEAGAAERQTQLFWTVPGKNYDYETTGFGIVTLGNENSTVGVKSRTTPAAPATIAPPHATFVNVRSSTALSCFARSW